ncbi:DUF6230 family protein [Streptomyces sp. JH14]|uniref:DUF6230 family protein n=1 Tax=Streptomyces sp. JH14 TaxID=2793630 RepID=UPI0023F912C8|nr:DUF6230 family protein [Streptomyces sp. JH14]MDF6040692.1 DUF6230 family protein [Streptomyces sp. JH14]
MSHRSGRTSWKRFAAVLVPGVTAATVLGIAMAQGALAASFFVSGQRFQVTADTLRSRGVSIYGMVDVSRAGTLVPVVVIGARNATISGLCQSVVAPVPVLGPYTLRFTGGEQRPVEARDLFLDVTSASVGQANLDGLDIGVAAGAVTKGPISPEDRNSQFFDPNGFAQQAVSSTLTDVRVTAVAVTAATFNVPDFGVRLEQGRHECF